MSFNRIYPKLIWRALWLANKHRSKLLRFSNMFEVWDSCVQRFVRFFLIVFFTEQELNTLIYFVLQRWTKELKNCKIDSWQCCNVETASTKPYKFLKFVFLEYHKNQKKFKSLYGFGARFVNITDVFIDFEPCSRSNLVSVCLKSIKLGQRTTLYAIFHMVVSIYRLFKIWNSPSSLRNSGMANKACLF